ncbi:hypothetical protein DPEC_G00323090 [Dallia pectoralis]|uniref:Uncharacterized protein n=1 Tax=Dallia pectoralis TaxID=75939 RepID=A0ACC2FAM9_DALPE|nr:hypothetical protein DPEC_G00323090 [Dallia pectoralis]
MDCELCQAARIELPGSSAGAVGSLSVGDYTSRPVLYKPMDQVPLGLETAQATVNRTGLVNAPGVSHGLMTGKERKPEELKEE